MNNEQSGDRLDRIEAIVESNSRAIQAMSERQAAMMEQQAVHQAAYQLKHQEIMAIVESNYRAIQAISEQQTTNRLKHEEAMAEMRELMKKMAETQSSLTKILINHDEDRPTILRRLMTIENKVDRILEQNQE
ncbi:MAG: hypothetical protein AAGA80_12245 [Cyanobacteria bacterium P01_F01_bin.143]